MDSPIKITADITDSANSLLKEPAKSTGSVVATFVDFFHNTVLLEAQKYNLKAVAILEKYKEDLNKQIASTPEEQSTEPSINIWGQTMDSLKWNMDDQQEHIREMFTKILLADINKAHKSKVQPSFIEIVKQLSQQDAEFLQSLNRAKNVKMFSTMEIRWKNEKEVFQKVPGSPFIVMLHKTNRIEPEDKIELEDMKVINNLERLGIIKVKYEFNKPADKALCDVMFFLINDRFPVPTPTREDYNKTTYYQGMIEITDFGKDFMDICL